MLIIKLWWLVLLIARSMSSISIEVSLSLSFFLSLSLSLPAFFCIYSFIYFSVFCFFNILLILLFLSFHFSLSISLFIGAPVAAFFSPLAYQTRTIALSTDSSCFAIGCIEGRIAIEYFDEMDKKDANGKSTLPKLPAGQPGGAKSFTFKCHR
jgi:hypothetical protein